MGLVDSIKNFFGNNTETMNTGTSEILRNAPVNGYDDFYDDFVYPYSPMQRSKRFPKIINAYALQARERADVRGFINHKQLIDDLDARITALEEYEYAERFEVRTMATRSNNFSNGDSSTLQQEYTIASNEEIIGVRSVYIAYGNTLTPAGGFRVNSFGFSVTDNPANNNKDVLLKVSITNQSGQYYGGVYAIVYYTIYRKE